MGEVRGDIRGCAWERKELKERAFQAWQSNLRHLREHLLLGSRRQGNMTGAQCGYKPAVMRDEDKVTFYCCHNRLPQM